MKSSEQPPTDVVVLMSGGIDSSALAKFCLGKGYATRGVFIDYGQAARDLEWRAVEAIASHLSMGVHRFECSGPSFGAGELAGRNLFLVSAAIFLGQIQHGLVTIGVHAGTAYYDCSPQFIERLSVLIEEQSIGAVTLSAPFLHWQKSQILTYFQNAELPLETTYSCESGTLTPCGSCASCRDRGALGC
jgi:7-cyano-7-deazaguanine synthase